MGGGHTDPEKRGGSLKNIFSALRASVWPKNKGGVGFSSQSVLRF